MVLASKGYPEKYEKGIKINGIKLNSNKNRVKIYHAGTKKDGNGNYVTNGGRVLNIVTKAKSKKKSLDLAYEVCNKISWKGYFFRKDISS